MHCVPYLIQELIEQPSHIISDLNQIENKSHCATKKQEIFLFNRLKKDLYGKALKLMTVFLNFRRKHVKTFLVCFQS